MTLHIELDPIEEARLKEAARQEGVEPSAYVKKLVTEHLPPANGETGRESLRERYGHLFGTVHGGPIDMAAHPEKYMKGFGEGENRQS